MPGEQLIQTLPDPRLKSSPDRSRRCSFIFLKRFADGWKNQCPTEESGGGWSKGKKGRERERGMERRRRERGEGREEHTRGGRSSWRGWWEGGWAGGTCSHRLPPRFGISCPHGGPRAEQGFSRLCAMEPGHRCSESPPLGWCLPTPSTTSAPMRAPNLCHGVSPPRSDTAGFHGNTSQFPTRTHRWYPRSDVGEETLKVHKAFGWKFPMTLFFMKIALLRSPSFDSLRRCSPSTILGSHPAHAALQGAPGWDRDPQCLHAGRPWDSSILPVLLGRDAAKRDFICSGQWKSLLKTKLRPEQLI